MGTIAEDLALIKQIQVDIKGAIEAHGVQVGNAPFVDYPTFIGQISSGPPDTDPDGFWGSEAATWGGASVTWGA